MSQSVDFQLVGGLEVCTDSCVCDCAPDQLCENGPDAVFFGRRKGEFCEVPGEARVELLSIEVVAVCDEEVFAEIDHFLGLVAEVFVVLCRKTQELTHLLIAQVDVVHQNQHFLCLSLLLAAHALLYRNRYSL